MLQLSAARTSAGQAIPVPDKAVKKERECDWNILDSNSKAQLFVLSHATARIHHPLVCTS